MGVDKTRYHGALGAIDGLGIRLLDGIGQLIDLSILDENVAALKDPSAVQGRYVVAVFEEYQSRIPTFLLKSTISWSIFGAVS
jgi:hypothetical protein